MTPGTRSPLWDETIRQAPTGTARRVSEPETTITFSSNGASRHLGTIRPPRDGARDAAASATFLWQKRAETVVRGRGCPLPLQPLRPSQRRQPPPAPRGHELGTSPRSPPPSSRAHPPSTSLGSWQTRRGGPAGLGTFSAGSVLPPPQWHCNAHGSREVTATRGWLMGRHPPQFGGPPHSHRRSGGSPVAGGCTLRPCRPTFSNSAVCTPENAPERPPERRRPCPSAILLAPTSVRGTYPRDPPLRAECGHKERSRVRGRAEAPPPGPRLRSVSGYFHLLIYFPFLVLKKDRECRRCAQGPRRRAAARDAGTRHSSTRSRLGALARNGSAALFSPDCPRPQTQPAARVTSPPCPPTTRS